MGNQRGSVVLIGLILAAGIAGVGISFVMFVNGQNVQQSRNRAKDEVLNLGIALRMLYSEPKNCSQNLASGAFGSTIGDIKSRSEKGLLKVLYPSQGPKKGLFLATNESIYNLKVKELKFTEITELPAPEKSYRANLSITLADSSGLGVKAVTIPFYLVSDDGGTIKSCFATSYPFARSLDPVEKLVTMEDFLCSQYVDGDGIYSPSQSTCLPKSAIVGQK